MVNSQSVLSRSQAESYIKLGKVTVNGSVVKRAGTLVRLTDDIQLNVDQQYVSRAALKLESVANLLGLLFKDKVVLDVGSSTGGFTDFSLKQGAKQVIAVELGKDQMHPSLVGDPRIELHEKTDIRDYAANRDVQNGGSQPIDIVVADISFMSLRDILPSLLPIINQSTKVVAMVKPQFEAGKSDLKHHGIIKNEKIRREILGDFEQWARKYFVVLNKADSDIPGAKGNRERFYLLKKTK
jgi:23S rRNA (cytidine1920-2'-O)/16S rRNA (cytidine1409-2'-O)-methyltransferase